MPSPPVGPYRSRTCPAWSCGGRPPITLTTTGGLPQRAYRLQRRPIFLGVARTAGREDRGAAGPSDFGQRIRQLSSGGTLRTPPDGFMTGLPNASTSPDLRRRRLDRARRRLAETITAAVGSCDSLLALIGNEWLKVTDTGGGRRIDDPTDFVRLEIEAALSRDVRVIPVLVEGARMSRVEELPPSLAKLARRQAIELSPSRFKSDLHRLLEVLDGMAVDSASIDTSPNGRDGPSDRASPRDRVSNPRRRRVVVTAVASRRFQYRVP